MNDPSITLLPDGGWIAVWTADNEESGNEFTHTLFQRFDAAGNPVGPETQVGDPDVFYFDASVLPLSDGGWLVIHDGGDIVQQRFDSDGNAVGGETQINTVGGDLRGPRLHRAAIIGRKSMGGAEGGRHWAVHGGSFA